MSPSVIDDRLVLGYEDLRRQALGGVGTGRGLVLFLRQGMRSWIEAWPRTWHVPVDPSREHAPASTMPGAVRADVVRLLASLVLHQEPEVRR